MKILETQEPFGFNRTWVEADPDEVERRFKVKLDRRRDYLIDQKYLYYKGKPGKNGRKFEAHTVRLPAVAKDQS